MSDTDRSTQVLELARAVMPLDIAPDLELDTSLEGVIDSFIIIELVTEVETELGIMVDLDEVMPEDFENVRAIAQMVERFS
ncbi:MAG: acyl carrier protein [bacterium]|nr:acyl carrier protein [bacterium]MCP5044811.1 acyl carrier protein [bacterium]